MPLSDVIQCKAESLCPECRQNSAQHFIVADVLVFRNMQHHGLRRAIRCAEEVQQLIDAMDRIDRTQARNARGAQGSAIEVRCADEDERNLEPHAGSAAYEPLLGETK